MLSTLIICATIIVASLFVCFTINSKWNSLSSKMDEFLDIFDNILENE